MHELFFLARIYPYWALPLCLILGQLGVFCRRRRFKTQWIFWFWISILIASSVAWIYGRGDRHSDEWVRTLISGEF